MAARDDDVDSFTTVEAVPDGWWYTLALPSGARAVAVNTDSDLPGFAALRDATGFLRALNQTTLVRMSLAAAVSCPAPRVLDARSMRLIPAAGSGWLAVGTRRRPATRLPPTAFATPWHRASGEPRRRGVGWTGMPPRSRNLLTPRRRPTVGTEPIWLSFMAWSGVSATVRSGAAIRRTGPVNVEPGSRRASHPRIASSGGPSLALGRDPMGVGSEQTESVHPLNPGGDPRHSITLAQDRPLSKPILAPFSFRWNSVAQPG